MRIRHYFFYGLLSTLLPGAPYIGSLALNEWNYPYFWSGQFLPYSAVTLAMGLVLGFVAVRIQASIWQVILSGSFGWFASFPLGIGILSLIWLLPGRLCPKTCMDSAVLSFLECHVVAVHASIWIVASCVVGSVLLALIHRAVKPRIPLSLNCQVNNNASPGLTM